MDGDEGRLVADSPTPVLHFSNEEWQTFLHMVKGGVPCGDVPVEIEHGPDGWVTFRSPESGVELLFDREEYEAFAAGVRDGEFDLPG